MLSCVSCSLLKSGRAERVSLATTIHLARWMLQQEGAERLKHQAALALFFAAALRQFGKLRLQTDQSRTCNIATVYTAEGSRKRVPVALAPCHTSTAPLLSPRP